MQYFLPSKAQQCPRLANQLTARALISYNSRAVQNLKVVLSKRKRVFSVLWFMFTLHVLLTAGLLCLREDEKEGCRRSSSYDKRYPRCPDCAATAKTYLLLWNVCSLYYILALKPKCPIHSFKNYVGSTKNSHNSIYHVIFLLMFEFVWASDNISCEYLKMLGEKGATVSTPRKKNENEPKKTSPPPHLGFLFPKNFVSSCYCCLYPPKLRACYIFLDIKHFGEKVHTSPTTMKIQNF